jgi:fibronectin type 3 domain-containing protein
VRPNTTSYKDSGLAAATRYTYRVYASNAAGDSPFSAPAIATTLPNPPAAPSGLAISGVSQTALRLDWQDNSASETAFQILRQKDGDPAFTAVGTVGTNLTTYTDRGLEAKTRYRYTVRAQNAGGSSADSKVAQAATLAEIPAAPDGLAVSILSDNAVELDWKDNSTNETGFRIERSTDGGATFHPLAAVNANIITSRDLGLAGQTFYTYRLCAFNAEGDSRFSAPAVAPMPSLPAAPDRLTVTPAAPGVLRLDWADNSANETHFLIERSVDGGVTFPVARMTGPSVAQFVDSRLLAGASYRYRVRASNAGGASAYSNAVDAATPPAQPILALAGPLPRQVVQRGSTNLGSVPVAGTVSEGVDRVEARAVKMEGATGTETDWTPVATAADFRDGAFDGRLEVAAGGWYEIQVRAGAQGTVVATASVPRVGVGEVFVVCGQSNSANYGRPAQAPTDDRVSALTLDGWQFGSDPQPLAPGTDGSPWPRLGELLVNELQVPVAFASTGVGGTASAQWLPGGELYPRLSSVLQRLGPGGERAVLWHQGETDAARGVRTETYRQNLAAIIQASRRDAGWAVPWVVAGVAYEPATPPAWRAAVRAAQSRLWAEGTALEGPETDSLTGYAYRWDGKHFTRAGLLAHAARWLEKLRGHFFNPDGAP